MSSMSGWLIRPFKLNRPISHAEMSANLCVDGLPSVDPLNKGAIHLDATCLEYHDRYFLFRGWGVLGGGFFALFAVALAAAVSYGFLQSSKGQVEPVFWGIAIMVLMCGLPALYALKAFFFKDAFRYTHYPIRFNRDNRMVYVFTGGARQTLKVPFDEAFFFINEDAGAGGNAVRVYDLRMHVLKDEKIIHTVSIGSDSGGSPGIILAHWEMIRRFMDQGLDALPFPPLGIFASSRVSVKNSFIIPFAVFSGALRWILSPFLILIGVTKYIALGSSKRPVWPKAIDAECRPAGGGRVFKEPIMYGDLPGGAGRRVCVHGLLEEGGGAGKVGGQRVGFDVPSAHAPLAVAFVGGRHRLGSVRLQLRRSGRHCRLELKSPSGIWVGWVVSDVG